MKTNKPFFFALMALPLLFSGCSNDDSTDAPVSVVEDGFYVVGEATSIPNLSVEDAEIGRAHV